MTDLPTVSLLLPIRNEATFITQTLTAIACQTYPIAKLEVVIADGRSTDGTSDRVTAFVEQNPALSVHVVDNPELIFSTGFNRAFQRSTGAVVIMIGGHCVLARNYVELCVKQLQTSDAACVGGIIHTIGSTPMAEAIALAMSTPFGVGGVAFRTVKEHIVQEVDTVAFAAYHRWVFEQCGLLDEAFVRNQDDEFNYRLRKGGGKILLNSAIVATYSSRSSLARLWSQYYQYGYWKVRVMQKHPHQMRVRQFVPALFVGTFLVGGLAAPFYSVARVLWLAVLLAYALANLGATIWTARGNHWKHIFVLPFIFLVLHCSYGLGFLHGLVAQYLPRSVGERLTLSRKQ